MWCVCVFVCDFMMVCDVLRVFCVFDVSVVGVVVMLVMVGVSGCGKMVFVW